jgi:hypothetical protein
MNTVITAVIAVALSSPLLHFAEQEAATAGQSSGSSAVQLPAPAPVSPIGTAGNAVQITNGPVVENVTDTTAEIAWSTNVNAGTTLHYGSDPSHLDQTAGMPWGGLTHRVSLKNLNPNTTYYFKAESAQGQGTGTQAQAEQASFQTKPAGTQESRK